MTIFQFLKLTGVPGKPPVPGTPDSPFMPLKVIEYFYNFEEN
jgi:hypothetical protein